MKVHEYTVAEFRILLRQAMNQADAGEPVIIERYGDFYTLNRSDGKVKARPAENEPEQEVSRPKPKIELPEYSDGASPHGYGKGLCKIQKCNIKYRTA